jgi:CRISPR/Cas system-associated exonuclease Cas4 (RecB family)
MKNEPFLRLVAQAFIYKDRSVLKDCCFIFPNIRAGVFFEKELKSIIGANPVMMPSITTITDFVDEITDSVEATRIEQLFFLYDAYKTIFKENADTFDKFVYWGDMIINDFNDVDRNLADAKSIFKNVENLKKINSNYLTEEQKKIIEEFFPGSTFVSDGDGNEMLWKETSDNSEAFLKLWNGLFELYEAFGKKLGEKGLTYSGKAYKDAASKIANMRIEDFRSKQYVFVGFNVLSISEAKIFSLLKTKGIADFYWDINSPALRDENNNASFFVKKNSEEFKSKLDINEQKIDTFPEIEVVSVPSEVGQVKYLNTLLGNVDANNAIENAIVLPDENLLMPLLNTIGGNSVPVNITMGYPLKNSAIYTLMYIVMRMHRHSEGKDYFLFEDINELMTHVYVRGISEKESDAVLKHMKNNNAFKITKEEIENLTKKSGLNKLFEINNGSSYEAILGSFYDIIGFVKDKMRNLEKTEKAFIDQYLQLLRDFDESVKEYKSLITDEATFYYLIDKLISTSQVAFDGRPLEGIQIMGVLETRNIDFQNIYILSMNERIFPRRHFSKSFIPDIIRRGYGLSTTEHQDSIYAYYFYRLISRAEKVYLIYDSRDHNSKSGEPSRYITQLDKIYTKCNIKFSSVSIDVKTPDDVKISVKKDDRIMKLINRYSYSEDRCDKDDLVRKIDDKEEVKCLSASSIKEYMECPLRFYFERVEDLSLEDEMSEFMDHGSFGSIIHQVVHELYSKNIGQPINIDAILKDNDEIKHQIKRAINKVFLHKKEEIDLEKDLVGVNILMSSVIERYVKGILEYDKNSGNTYTFVQGEEKERFGWKLPSGRIVNLVLYIDRVDRENGKLRIVDYKTGSDATGFKDINDLFDNDKDNKKKGMVQVLMYCDAYSQHHNINDPIMPLIYKVTKLDDSGVKIDKKQINKNNYNDVKGEFMGRLNAIIEEIFNKEVAFTQTNNIDNCKYCKFTEFCHR